MLEIKITATETCDLCGDFLIYEEDLCPYLLNTNLINQVENQIADLLEREDWKIDEKRGTIICRHCNKGEN